MVVHIRKPLEALHTESCKILQHSPKNFLTEINGNVCNQASVDSLRPSTETFIKKSILKDKNNILLSK